MVSIKLGLNQFIIPQRCNFPPATPQVSRISFPHGMCGSQTHLLFWGWGVRYLHLPHVGDECFLCACAAPTIHMRVRKHPNLHVHRLGGGGRGLLLAPCVVFPAAGGLVPGGEGVPRWRWQGQWFLALAGFKPGFVLYSVIFFFVSTITHIYYSFTLLRDDSKIS